MVGNGLGMMSNCEDLSVTRQQKQTRHKWMQIGCFSNVMLRLSTCSKHSYNSLSAQWVTCNIVHNSFKESPRESLSNIWSTWGRTLRTVLGVTWLKIMKMHNDAQCLGPLCFFSWIKFQSREKPENVPQRVYLRVWIATCVLKVLQCSYVGLCWPLISIPKWKSSFPMKTCMFCKTGFVILKIIL